MPRLPQRYARHLRHLWAQGGAAIQHDQKMTIAFALAQRIMEDRFQGKKSIVATLRTIAQFESLYGARLMGPPWHWRNARGKKLMSEEEARYALAYVPEAPACWSQILAQTTRQAS